MKQGGTIRFEQRTLHILRIVGLVTPVLLTLYGSVIALGLVPSVHYVGPVFFAVLMALWMLLGLYQYLVPAQTKAAMMQNLVLYHLFATLYLLCVSGFSVPFLGALALLYLTSYIYFSTLGAVVSMASFIAVALFDLAIHPGSHHHVLYVATASLSTMLVGTAVITLNRIKEYDRETIVSSRRKEALQRDRLLTLVNNLADAILGTNRHGVIQLFNAASLNLLDTNASLDGQSIDDVLQLVDENGTPTKLVPLLKKARSVTVNDTLIMPTADERIRLEIMYAPIRSSFDTPQAAASQDGYVIIIRDITKSKSLEEERDEFISVVSHELRTPIAITEGAIDNAQAMFEKDTSSTDQVVKTLKTAHEQILFLSTMVNDLSTLSRAERNTADASETIDITQLAHGLFQQYHPEAEKKGLHFNLALHGQLGTVTTSRLYLHELLQNFITNAIKYTKEGQVDLIIERQGDELYFAVKDSGIGISKSDQTKIFRKFYRSEDYRTRETGGTGLGLYVAAKLARKLGCDIALKSRLNHGSTFSFTLPADPSTR